jgi:hypothetical protein
MKKIVVALVLFSAILACKKDEPVQETPAAQAERVRLTLQPTFGASDLQLDQTITTNQGYKVQFTELKCYLTSLRNGSNVLATAAFFDYRTNGTLLCELEGKHASFASLDGFLGVDSVYNHDDPTVFANNNPLNIMIANDMHWGWNPGYIFVKVEARIDTINDGIDNFNHFASFHIGVDSLLQNLSLSGYTWLNSGNNVYTLPLKLNMQTFLQNGNKAIDLKTEYSSHSAPGQGPIGLKVMDNFRAAIEIY